MNLLTLLRSGRKHDASDIHLVVGMPPIFRVGGELITSTGEAITKERATALAFECLNEEQKRRLERDWQLCFSTTFGERDRARVTVYYRSGCPELCIRLSEPVIRTREELQLPAIVDDIVRRPNGLFLVTGPTGVGKTTTLHYIIDLINTESRKKIITIEDPIEYTHASKRSLVIQQEVLTDVPSFQQALVHVLRQDPDVIAIGEMRDRDTMYTAMMAAETGHLVLATLHTPDAVHSIQRIVSAFPEGQQNEVRFMLANSLQMVVAQQLLPDAQGKRRVLCCEVLVGTQPVRHNIRENTIHKLYTELQAGRKHGMMMMDQTLLDMYQKGEITYDTALSVARDPATIKKNSAPEIT
ncbi:MAG TPA: PilT/PilU family type 4a pilus ATPase [Phycisphaerae bacterium]|nr:PilT/PilU family type 4a pilus ATPase [Phycisphaerae bacterium]